MSNLKEKLENSGEREMTAFEAYQKLEKLFDSIREIGKDDRIRAGAFADGTNFSILRKQENKFERLYYINLHKNTKKTMEFCVYKHGLKSLILPGFDFNIGNKSIHGDDLKFDIYNSEMLDNFTELSTPLVKWLEESMKAKNVDQMTALPVKVRLSPELESLTEKAK